MMSFQIPYIFLKCYIQSPYILLAYLNVYA